MRAIDASDSLLKIARQKRGKSIHFVAKAVRTSPGNLSRVENLKQRPSPKLAARLAAFFAPELTELQILYPERFEVGVKS
jgi:putative transcriptional regulator